MTRGTVQFVGLSGYEYPHTRVRCYRFAEALGRHGYATRVFSFHDRLASHVPEAAMYGLSDIERLKLILRGAARLALRPGSLLYVQKVHYHALSALILHRLLGTPYVLDYDDWEVGVDPYGVPLFCGFKNARITRALFGTSDPARVLYRVARRARLTVCSSHFLLRRLGEITAPVAYIPTGVDTTRFRARREPHDGVTILWNGVVWGEMIRDNILIMIRALPEVLGVAANVRLRIIAQGEYLDDVRKAVADLGLAPAVEFVGWVHPDAMPEELARADIGVLPLAHDDPWTRGKSPTKLFEYMAAGLAVIVMDGGEASHVVEHDVSGLVAADGRDFACRLRELATSPPLRMSLGAAARERVEQSFSLDVIGRSLAHELRRCWR